MGRLSNETKIERIISKNFELREYSDENMDFGKCWMKKDSDQYFCHDGLLNDYKFLLDHDIDELIEFNLGFSSKNQKYYGWSHRAIFGFGIGYKIKKGDVCYVSETIEEEIEHLKSWHSEDSEEINTSISDMNISNSTISFNHITKHKEPSKTDKIQKISYDLSPLIGTTLSGEFEIRSLEESKEIAIRFAKEVS